MPNKDINDMPDIRLREAIAAFLYGPKYTAENIRGIAILGKGRWYCYPTKGTYTRIGNFIKVNKDGEDGQVYV
jgi:hypothetical protein